MASKPESASALAAGAFQLPETTQIHLRTPSSLSFLNTLFNFPAFAILRLGLGIALIGVVEALALAIAPIAVAHLPIHGGRVEGRCLPC